MRILQVTRYGTVKGGAETYVRTITAGLRDGGHDVGRAFALDAAPGDDMFHVAALERSGERAAPADGAAQLQQALDRFAPDVVHVHTADAPWVAPFCAEQLPTVLAVHDHRLHCPVGTKYWTAWRSVCTVKPGLRCLAYNVTAHCGSLKANVTLKPHRDWRAARDAARGLPSIQVFSEWMRDAVVGAGIELARVRMTHYPVPPQVRPATIDDEDRRPIVLASGRLNKEKGFHELIKSLDHTGGVPVHLVIAGDGHERPALERRARRQSGGHRITFTGWLTERQLAGWMQRATLVALPSMWPEPFGITGIEAMARGKPVVAFDSGGIREWLEDRVTGVLVPHADVDRLGQAIRAVIKDVPARERMAEAALARVDRDFSLERHLEALMRLYAEART